MSRPEPCRVAAGEAPRNFSLLLHGMRTSDPLMDAFFDHLTADNDTTSYRQKFAQWQPDFPGEQRPHQKVLDKIAIKVLPVVATIPFDASKARHRIKVLTSFSPDLPDITRKSVARPNQQHFGTFELIEDLLSVVAKELHQPERAAMRNAS